MSERIRVGIIGVNPDRGWGQAAHAPAVAALDQFELRAICTTRMATAGAAAERFGAALAFDDARALIEHPDVDLVTIAVNVPSHRQLVEAVVAAGKPVYCEWPLGNGLAEAIALADSARRAGIRTAIGLQGRSSPWVNQVRDLVAAGYVGRVLSTSMVASGQDYAATIPADIAIILDRARGANLATVHLGHYAEVLCSCLGEFVSLGATLATQRPEVTLAETGESVPVSAPDQIAIIGTLQGGATAALHIRGGRSRGPSLLWEINGTDGELHIAIEDGYVHMSPATVRGGRLDDRRLSDIPIEERYRWVPAGIPDGPALHVAQAYARLAGDLRNGTMDCPSFADAIVRHRMLEAVQIASDTGTAQSYLQTT